MPYKNKLVDSALKKHAKGQKLSLREYQIIVGPRTPSSLWHDFFPEFLVNQGLTKSAKLTPLVWDLLLGAANKQHDEYLKKLVAENSKPSVTLGKRKIIYLL